MSLLAKRQGPLRASQPTHRKDNNYAVKNNKNSNIFLLNGNFMDVLLNLQLNYFTQEEPGVVFDYDIAVRAVDMLRLCGLIKPGAGNGSVESICVARLYHLMIAILRENHRMTQQKKRTQILL